MIIRYFEYYLLNFYKEARISTNRQPDAVRPDSS